MKNKTKFEEEKIRKIKEGWEVKSFKDAVEINPYRSLNKNTPAKYVSMSALKPFVKKISFFEKRMYKCGTKFKNNDTLLAKITPCLENGKTAFVNILDKEEVAFGSSEFIVLSNKLGKTDPKFLYYLVIEPNFRKAAINSMTGTSGRQRVQNNILEKMPITLPDILEQKKIAKILSSFDDRIELNNKINSILEQISKTIFKHWFINFEFPNEQGKPYKSSGGEFIDSELGKIPKGWKVGMFGDICTVKGGYAYKSNDFLPNGDFPIIKIKNIQENRIVNMKDLQFISKEISDNTKEFWLSDGDIVMAMTGATVGKFGIVVNLPKFDHSLLNQRVAKFFSDNIVFVFMILLREIFKKEIIDKAHGSAQANFSARDIQKIKIILPDKKLINYFNKVMNPLFNLIIKNIKENIILENLRDTLLPKLITGKIRVNLEDTKEG
jgi:type I restriction enzyme, S subunit